MEINRRDDFPGPGSGPADFGVNHGLAPDGYRLVQIGQPGPSAHSGTHAEPSDTVRTFVFMSNLAAQEATGDEAASVTADRVLTRLQGSHESRVYLFGLVRETENSDNGDTSNGSIAPVGDFGVPVTSAYEQDTHTAETPEYAAFIHLALPLLEETETAELDLVFDAEYLPVPGADFNADGTEVAHAALTTAESLARAADRRVLHIGTQSRALDDATSHDPLGVILQERGFEALHHDIQVGLDVPHPDTPAIPLLPRGTEPMVWFDYAIPEHFVPQVLQLLTVVSTDADFGALTVEPILWTRKRLADARRRLRDRRAHTMLVAIVADGEIYSLTELARHEAADPTVAEWTMTVTAREHRNAGYARAAKLVTLAQLPDAWPRVRRTFASHARDDAALRALDERLGARALSTAATWEKHLPLRGVRG